MEVCMKAVILAAGRGTRISSLSGGSPKCLLKFGHYAILDYQISALLRAGISDIALVVGYQHEKIVEHVSRQYSHFWDSFTFIKNPRYAETNNICSLQLTRPWVADSAFVCLNADVLCHPGIIGRAVQMTSDVAMIMDPEWRDETMKVIIKEGHIVKMSKAITRSEYSGTYLGITLFSGRVVQLLFEEIDKFIGQGKVNEFFNVAVEKMISYGIQVDPILTYRLPWAEIDDPTDYRFAEANVYPFLPPPKTFGAEVPYFHAPDPVAA